MAGALRGRLGIIAQLLIDLDLNPSPDHPVSVEVRCDCLEVIPREQVLPLSITTGFCVLSTCGDRAVGGRVRLINWGKANGFSISFGCSIYELLDNGEVVLRAHLPLLQAWKNDSAWWPLIGRPFGLPFEFFD